MIRKYFLLMLPVIATLLLSGCKKDESPTEPGTASSTPSAGQPMPTFESSPDFGGALATIMYEMAAPLPGFPAIQTNLGFAIFGKGVDGGSVTVNNSQIGKLTQGSYTYYVLPNPNNPLETLSSVTFNGSNHNFAVSGNGEIPALNGSVKSPVNFNLTAPSANATISKSTDLKVTWGGGSSNKVLVQLVGVTSKTVKVYQELNDNGTYTIPAADLSGFSGDCLLYVVKYNYNTITGGGKKYYLISEIVKNNAIKVN